METQPLLADLLASFYDGNPDAIAVYDRDGLFVSCNATALHISGYTLEQLAGSHYREHIYAPDRERVDEVFRGALEGHTGHFESTIREKTGRIVPIEVHLFPATIAGRIEGVFAQARDAIALRSAEQSLAVNQQRFRSLFEYHPDAIAALTSDGSISRVNVAFEAETGYYGEQIIGKPWIQTIAPELREGAESALRSAGRGEAVEFDSLLLDRVGNRIEVRMNLVPLRVAERIEGAYAIAKNVAAERGAERAIALQGERIRELYLAAAGRGESVEAQIDNTLALGCRLFGFDYGYVTRFDETTITIQNAMGEGTGVRAGAVYPKANALSRLVSGDRQTVFIPDLDEPPWNADPAHDTAPWRSYFATKLVVNNREYGAMVFAGRLPRGGGIPETDRDLLQLMALFLAAALERAAHAERIEQLAFYDALTGLPNRVLFGDRISQAMAAAKRYNRGFAVMYLDLDAFKEINDSYGHAAGDLVLRSVAERLLPILRESDTLARFGGDEFVILQPVVNGESDSADLAEKIVAGMQAPFEINGVDRVVHTSIGVALYPHDGSTAEELMDRADQALYRAKRAGRNGWQFFSEPTLHRRKPGG